MVDISKYADKLIERDGIYFAEQQSAISYPESGNQDCFQLEDESFWFKHRNRCIIQSVKKYCDNVVFFDIGGGNGFVSTGLQNNNIESVLVEPGITGCLNAKKRNLENIICSTLEDASFKKASLEAVGLFDVVEHIEHDNKFLTMINSYMKSGGKVFITVPAYQQLWSNEDVDAGHFRRYTTSALEKKLENAGFKIIQSTYIFSILPFFVGLFRTMPSKFGFNKNSGAFKKHQNEHKTRNGFLSKMLNKVLDIELRRIDQGKRIPIGGSCFVVAIKK